MVHLNRITMIYIENYKIWNSKVFNTWNTTLVELPGIRAILIQKDFLNHFLNATISREKWSYKSLGSTLNLFCKIIYLII